MPRVPVVLQTAETDCGPACLAALARAFGHRAALPQLRTQLDPGRDGTTALALRDAAGPWGVQLNALLATPDEVAERIGELPLPSVIHLSRQHYVVADKVRRDGSVRVMDPAVGRRTFGRDELREQASGLVLVAEPSEVHDPPPVPPKRPATLLQVLRTARGDLAGAGALSTLLALSGLGLPVMTALIVDGVVADSSGHGTWLAGGIALAFVVGLLSLARYLVLARLQQRLAGSLSTRVAGTLFSRHLRFFDRRSVGDLFGRVESAHAVHALLSVTLLGTVLDAVLTIGYLSALAVIAPTLAGIAVTGVGVSLLVTLAIARACASLRREEILVAAEASTTMVDSIAGIATLRAYGAEPHILAGWTALLDRRLALTRRRARLSALSLSLLSGVIVGTPLVVLVVASSSDGFTAGAALGLMALASATLAPVSSLAAQLVQAADLRPMLDRIEDLETADGDRRGGASPDQLRGGLSLRGVRFRYDRFSDDVLGPIDVDVRPGAKIGVLGPTGCGKSTLAHLLCGLYEPTAGTILLDGRELSGLDLASVRRQVGVVFQDNWLCSGTIREAVLAGRERYSDDDVWRALAQAQIAEELACLPLGLETRLSSGGQGLSGGQRQRLALARALLSNPAILILDEATSALDAHTERLIDAVLADLRITRVIITHRLGVVSDADELWMIDRRGRLVERGSPAELVARGGHYAALLHPSSPLGVT
ncbi:MAG: peptidase domain-containing ABC transporter [Tessaracoccus sp.]|uniref:peptidase domain-containing ABC transporter n=1 Tax=Tessaracoccus sp. TaxID=1971211 RepID=UPI001EC24B22|nr:peptidase domain-containing ABC transporter [Tessaracoccus sp.]MBK7821932.1 peptidase domain-containing ABC transporter [Tessaracoccus sp.]